jgi:ribosomal protein S18 acetylase RimI-like enzyme
MTPRLTYFKRYRMELDLARVLPPAVLPTGFGWRPWDDSLIEMHAEAKYLSFRDDLDSKVFPSLGHPVGCRDLMRAIRLRDGFCPGSTWLVAGPDGVAGTVQGLCDRSRAGAIQNLGVVPGCRGLGLGAALLLKALHGFRAVGIGRAYLEVTARNDAAVRLYRKYGFRSYRTIYKPVEVPEPAPVGLGI